MHILITGATGFIGRNLVHKLSNSPHQLLLLVRDPMKAKMLFGQSKRIEIIGSNELALQKKVEQFSPQLVIHLAAYSTSADDNMSMEKLVSTNLVFATKIVQLLRNCPVQGFINTGTFAEYCFGNGNLDSAYLYAATKTAFRSLLAYYQKLIGFKLIHVVPYTVYGENDSRKKVLHSIIESLDNPTAVQMTKGEQVLDFIYIDDVINFYNKLISHTLTLEDKTYEFHLGTGKGYEIREVASIIEKLTKKKANIHWGATAYRANDVMHAVAPIGKNIQLLGWKPHVDIKKGLQKLILNSHTRNGGEGSDRFE